MAGRLVIVAVLVAVAALVTLAYRRRRTADERLGVRDTTSGAQRWPDLPTELTAGVPTWVIFTTPLCVSCNAVRADLATHDPRHRVVTIDATERPELAESYGVRRAPTTVLADATGRVTERLVGPEAVRAHLRGDAQPAIAS